MKMRTEKDSLGEIKIPEKAYFGSNALRAAIHFHVSDLMFSDVFINALAEVKMAAAKTNMKLGIITKKVGKAIEKAATEVIEGKHYDEFIVDVFQTGSGTSTNMNTNEVIANRACEILKGKPGNKSLVHPNDHVNAGQSTNDVFPTAIHVAASAEIKNKLIPALKELRKSFRKKARSLAKVVKSGRTHMQDAVPITLGQEFSGYETMVAKAITRIEEAARYLHELPLGGTALGTGINAPTQFPKGTIAELKKRYKIPFKAADNYFEAMQNRSACVHVSAALSTFAGDLSKIARDLILLSSGPSTGLNEINLPELAPGSSIMPAKVNPVVPEAMRMVAATVQGNHHTVAIAGREGDLDLNVMMPIIAQRLLQSIGVLANAAHVFVVSCVDGITANKERCAELAGKNVIIVTALAPLIGYDKAAQVAKTALSEGKTVREVVLEQKLMDAKTVDRILDIYKLTQ